MELTVQETDLLRALGENVRQRRGDLGISQSALADDLGVSVPYISEIENGKRAVRFATLVRLAQALDSTPSALLSLREKIAQ